MKAGDLVYIRTQMAMGLMLVVKKHEWIKDTWILRAIDPEYNHWLSWKESKLEVISEGR